MSYENTLVELSRDNPELVVVTAENRAAIRNLPEKMPNRFVDVGICEMTMVGAAAGLALRGRVPVCHALATFLTMRAFEFIRTDVGIPGLPVKLVGCVPGFLSVANGPTHQAIEDISIMRGIPGMRVICPADEDELLAALPEIIDDPRPCYIRYNESEPAVQHQPYELGKAETVREGNEIALLTYGFLLEHVLSAADLLAKQGHSVRVVNMRSLAPVDEEAVLSAVSECRLTVTVEDHFVVGGLHTIVAETLMRHQTMGRVEPIALGQKWFKPALLEDVLEYEGFTGAAITDRVLGMLTEAHKSTHGAPETNGRNGQIQAMVEGPLASPPN